MIRTNRSEKQFRAHLDGSRTIICLRAGRPSLFCVFLVLKNVLYCFEKKKENHVNVLTMEEG